jgi:hypothetical protein
VTRLEEIQQRVDAATAGPWFLSYSTVASEPKIAEHDAFWTDERMDDGHSYERYEQCDACGGSCKHAMEAIDAHFAVASVQPSFGDTPTGQRLNDGKFIAAAREDVPWLLAEVERLRGELQEIAEPGGSTVIQKFHQDHVSHSGFSVCCLNCPGVPATAAGGEQS